MGADPMTSPARAFPPPTPRRMASAYAEMPSPRSFDLATCGKEEDPT
jgi:hypothetical protein